VYVVFIDELNAVPTAPLFANCTVVVFRVYGRLFNQLTVIVNEFAEISVVEIIIKPVCGHIDEFDRRHVCFS
jgi:hypothetical protein